MGDDEPYTTQRGTFTKVSSHGSTFSTSQYQNAFAAERARMLFGCYRRGDANDPEVYVMAVAAVLARYDADLIREVTDPNTGIQTTEKYMSFMPNAGELKVYCEGVAARKDRMRRLGDLPRPDFSRARLGPPDPVPGDLAQVFVPQGHKRYQSLVEWTTTANPRFWRFGKSSDGRLGLWVSWTVWEYRPREVFGPAPSEPQSLVLSDAARKVMRDIDAERTRTLPVDQEITP